MEARDVFTAERRADEALLWSGAPNTSFSWRLPATLFWLAVAALPVYCTLSGIQYALPTQIPEVRKCWFECAGWSLFMMVISLGVYESQILRVRRQRRFRYAITDQRVIFATVEGDRVETESIPLEHIDKASLVGNPKQPYRSILIQGAPREQMVTVNVSPHAGDHYPERVIYDIPKADAVCNLIRSQVSERKKTVAETDASDEPASIPPLPPFATGPTPRRVNIAALVLVALGEPCMMVLVLLFGGATMLARHQMDVADPLRVAHVLMGPSETASATVKGRRSIPWQSQWEYTWEFRDKTGKLVRARLMSPLNGSVEEPFTVRYLVSDPTIAIDAHMDMGSFWWEIGIGVAAILAAFYGAVLMAMTWTSARAMRDGRFVVGKLAGVSLSKLGDQDSKSYTDCDARYVANLEDGTTSEFTVSVSAIYKSGDDGEDNRRLAPPYALGICDPKDRSQSLGLHNMGGDPRFDRLGMVYTAGPLQAIAGSLPLLFILACHLFW